jgi:hypothetical protein
VWTTQLYATTSAGSGKPRAEAFGCHVIPHEPSNMVSCVLSCRYILSDDVVATITPL